MIIPKTYIAEISQPLIFLAGPIRGAPNWQDDAACFILSKNPDILVASPRRGFRDRIAGYIIEGEQNYFPRQRAWERHYLDLASKKEKKGAIMFWLPEEVEHSCGKAYGAMTRVEIGQCMTRYAYDKSVRFCVGSDGRFSELDTIAYDLSIDAPDKDIKKTLEEACNEALRISGL